MTAVAWLMGMTTHTTYSAAKIISRTDFFINVFSTSSFHLPPKKHLTKASWHMRYLYLLSLSFGVAHAPFACQRWGLLQRLAQCVTPALSTAPPRQAWHMRFTRWKPFNEMFIFNGKSHHCNGTFLTSFYIAASKEYLTWKQISLDA